MILALVFGGAFLYEAAQSKLTEYFALHPELLPSIEYYLTLDWLGIGAFVLACGPILMYCVAFRPPLGELRWPHLRHGWLGPAHTELKRTTSAPRLPNGQPFGAVRLNLRRTLWIVPHNQPSRPTAARKRLTHAESCRRLRYAVFHDVLDFTSFFIHFSPSAMMWTLRWCPLKQPNNQIADAISIPPPHPDHLRHRGGARCVGSVNALRPWPIRCCRRHESVAAAWPTLFVAFTPTESVLTSGKRFGPVFWDVFKHGAYLYIVRVRPSAVLPGFAIDGVGFGIPTE